MTTSETSPGAEHVRLSIFGLGYVGCVSAACFAARGHTVLGVDANPQKTEFIRDGRTPIVEEHDRRADRRRWWPPVASR